MHLSYKRKLEKLLDEHKLTKEILIHCIAKINIKVERAYVNMKRSDVYYKGEYTAFADIYHENKKEYDYWANYRKPFLYWLMSGYCISLDMVKEELNLVDKDKMPTYGTIDEIHEMLTSLKFTLI